VTLCRELTKQFETIHTLVAEAAPGWLAADANRSRGEFVLVLHALPAQAADPDTLPPAALDTLRVLLRELPLKQAVSLAAEISGAPRNGLYQHALATRQAADGLTRRVAGVGAGVLPGRPLLGGIGLALAVVLLSPAGCFAAGRRWPCLAILVLALVHAGCGLRRGRAGRSTAAEQSASRLAERAVRSFMVVP
jgi:hypothetical protein